MDENEAQCGGCRRVGELICCEGCPASFHPRCAGYESDKEVPAGDWYCWFCAQDRGVPFQHPVEPFRPPRMSTTPVMLASDDVAELFYRCRLSAVSEGFVELQYIDIKHEEEIIHRSSPRLWHGTTDKASWTVDDDNIAWRPNSRLFKIDKAAIATARSAEHDPQQQQQQPQAQAQATPKRGRQHQLQQPQQPLDARSPRSHAQPHHEQFKQAQQQGVQLAGSTSQEHYLRHSHQQEQQQQRPQGAAAAGERHGVQLQLQQAGSQQLLSPSASSGGGATPGNSGRGLQRSASMMESLAAGIERVPAGQIGAGLPVVVGGAGEEAFMAALHQVWRQRLGADYPRRMPACSLMAGQVVEPYHLWREVWSWGGPETVSQYKLWATVGFSFHPPASCTSVSNRIRRSYEAVLAPLDEAITAGTVPLSRPSHTRQPKHRSLQIRPPPVPGATGAGCGVRRNKSLNGAAAGPTTSSGGAPDTIKPRARSSAGNKRRRGSAWSDEEDGPAPDVGSDYEDPEDDLLGLGPEPGSSSSQEEGDGDQPEQLEAAASMAYKKEPGAAAASPAKQPSPAKHLTPSRPRGRLSGGGRSIAGQRPSEQMVLAKARTTPAAAQIKVGSVVDFRLLSQGGRCASGWRSGTVLDIHPGSDWEGGRRLLVAPRHHHHSSSSSSQHALQPGSPLASAAVAALAAAGCSAVGEGAAQKLLTPRGHLRHEVAGLLPSHGPGSPAAAKAGAAVPGAAAAAAAGPLAEGAADAEAADDRPAWVPLVWRGPATRPFARPVVMVRPHYVPPATPAANTAASTPFAQQQQQSMASGSSAASLPSQQRFVASLTEGRLVEVLVQGCWCPAEVLAVTAPPDSSSEPGAAAASAPTDSSSGAAGCAGVTCVVLRSLAPPESDGNVWRCSAAHIMRPAHPLQAAGYGVLQNPPRSDDLLQHQFLRKAMAPYTYAGGIQSYTCLHHMRGLSM